MLPACHAAVHVACAWRHPRSLPPSTHPLTPPYPPTIPWPGLAPPHLVKDACRRLYKPPLRPNALPPGSGILGGLRPWSS